jgi:hypothetical protein
VRLTDADREGAAATLRTAVGHGALDLHEFEERLDHVYAARYPSELVGVLQDLGAVAERPGTRAITTASERARPPIAAGGLAIAAVIVLGALVTPQLLWLLWLAIPFAKGRFHGGIEERAATWPGPRRWNCTGAVERG